MDIRNLPTDSWTEVDVSTEGSKIMTDSTSGFSVDVAMGG